MLHPVGTGGGQLSDMGAKGIGAAGDDLHGDTSFSCFCFPKMGAKTHDEFLLDVSKKMEFEFFMKGI